MDKRTKIWIIVFFALIVIGSLLYFVIGNAGGTVAVISVDGEEYDRIDLSGVKESYDFEIATQYGRNTVHVEPGGISVTEADCPDLICVHQGKITGGGIPIVCMPHRLVIQIEGGNIDG